MATFQIAKLVATLVLEDKGFKDKASESQKTSQKLFDTLKQGAVVAATVAAAFAVMKKGFDFAKEGAQILAMENKFDRLSTSIGTTSQALMKDLREATRGLYSDAELVAGANDIMSLGLAKNHDQVIRLARVIGGLNMNMNQLVLTMTNQTTMRFDALGVRVDGFKEKVKELQEQGMNANDAFNEAFLRQAEEQLLLVGEAADTSAGEFMRFEAAVKNSMDRMKKDLAQSATPALKWWNDQVEAEQRAVDVIRVHNPELYRQYQLTQMVTPQMKAYAEQVLQAGEYQDGWMRGLLATNQALQEAAPQLEVFGMKTQEFASLAVQVAAENKRYTESMAELRAEHAALNAELEENISKHGRASDEVAKTTEKLRENEAAMKENEKRHKEWINAKIGDLLMAKLAVDGLTSAELSYYLAFMVHSGQMTDEDAQLTMAIVANANEKAAAFANQEGTVRDLEDAMHELSMRYKTALNQSSTPIHYYYYISGEGSFPNPPAGGSWFIPGTGGGPSVKPKNDEKRTAMAGGGAVMAGQSYLVGERGREIFTPNQSGRVDPIKEQSSPRWDARDFAREFFKLAEERNTRLVG